MSGVEHSWEESRGMGVSYGYNRAEDLNVYRTGRELVFILVDTVCRGGNLLLDIGPRADGTIPVIMEERLTQMGNWLKVNGEAIYGTRPWRRSSPRKTVWFLRDPASLVGSQADYQRHEFREVH
jgi:alpha-L-fucosidase